jgi:hypothetical protein
MCSTDKTSIYKPFPTSVMSLQHSRLSWPAPGEPQAHNALTAHASTPALTDHVHG